ncbi:hypothetical protein AM493_15790 [Flavobacterium akiainvivens]|uniref:Uncharacterized protein n=1 Tax=Flavobacterium akiainvivens TaxID=1202724 RepID=A0A0M8MJX3_9FLAO|nr:hypothetical protein [Flavobacterium akiainvivens]KOS07337.1 hypothetical protein AM493_15790 [Flavobacterium akiainvivens]SFQ46844.1 hypothetical protein SAMN05444144_105139 [Flavobacterium akiainvivens]
MAGITNWLNFQYHVTKRMLEVAPRRSKKIKMLYIEYAAPAGSERVIKYRFRNALWYTFNNEDILNTRIPLPESSEGNEVTLTVHGFFRKNIYTLLLKPEYIHVIKIIQA